MGRVMPHVGAVPDDVRQVYVFPHPTEGQGTFTLVEDDGTTLDYLDGITRRVTFRWDDHRGVLSWTISGTYDGPSVFRRFRARRCVPDAQEWSPETSLAADGEMALR